MEPTPPDGSRGRRRWVHRPPGPHTHGQPVTTAAVREALTDHGPPDPPDEGELAMGFATDLANGVVRVHFSRPIAWVGLRAAHARLLGRALLDAADELERRHA